MSALNTPNISINAQIGRNYNCSIYSETPIETPQKCAKNEANLLKGFRLLNICNN